MAPASYTSDLIVIGGSSGALAPLMSIVAELPARLPAAVLIVLHRAPDRQGYLSSLLGRRSALPVADAIGEEPIRPGRIYLAPPDRHLLVAEDRLRVVRGPRENRSRPAIDPLFRTAARWFGPRVTAVLLSGMLNDGTYGLSVIKRHGGITVVQDPAQAESPDMPNSALQHVAVDHVLPSEQIGSLLKLLAVEPRTLSEAFEGDRGGQPMSHDELERGRESLRRPPDGALSPFVCPDCGGSMWQTSEADVVRLRCHVGHSFTEELLFAAQSDVVENALWSALRALEEKAELGRKMAGRARQRGHANLAQQHEESAAETEQQASALYALLMSGRRTKSSSHGG